MFLMMKRLTNLIYTIKILLDAIIRLYYTIFFLLRLGISNEHIGTFFSNELESCIGFSMAFLKEKKNIYIIKIILEIIVKILFEMAISLLLLLIQRMFHQMTQSESMILMHQDLLY